MMYLDDEPLAAQASQDVRKTISSKAKSIRAGLCEPAAMPLSASACRHKQDSCHCN
jgi:hypothetical protein